MGVDIFFSLSVLQYYDVACTGCNTDAPGIKLMISYVEPCNANASFVSLQCFCIADFLALHLRCMALRRKSWALYQVHLRFFWRCICVADKSATQMHVVKNSSLAWLACTGKGRLARQLLPTVRLAWIYHTQIEGKFTATPGGLTTMFYGCLY